MLKVHAQQLGNVIILRLEGRIMIGETTTLCHPVLSHSDASVLILDLARVSVIDARGLGMLLELREQTQSKGIELKLMNVTKLVKQVLEIARLDSVFQICTEKEVYAQRWRQARHGARHSTSTPRPHLLEIVELP